MKVTTPPATASPRGISWPLRAFGTVLHFLGRLWPWLRGRDFAMRCLIKRPTLWNALGAGPDWMVCRDGFALLANSGTDYASVSLKWWGELEPRTRAFVFAELVDGEAFLDLGANVGYFALLIANRFPNSQVVAVEPNPVLAGRICQSAARNGFGQRLEVAQMAVSDSAGMMGFHLDEKNSGHSRLENTTITGTIQVKCEVWDAWAAANPLSQRVGVVKLDVEGAELRALKGMQNLLREEMPSLVVEAYDNQLREFGSSHEELKSFLLGLGYREAAPFDGNLYLRHPGRKHR